MKLKNQRKQEKDYEKNNFSGTYHDTLADIQLRWSLRIFTILEWTIKALPSATTVFKRESS